MAKDKTPPLAQGWENGNLDEPVALESRVDTPPVVQVAVAPPAARTKIILEENDQIGPNGQFFGADGKGYMLRPGEVAEVPDSILNILDTAVESKPIVDSGQTVIGYRDKLRFPYRVITDRRPS